MNQPTIPDPGLSDWISRARQAQQTWALTSICQRLEVVKQFRHLLVSQVESLIQSAQSDIQKPRAEIIAGDLLPLADSCRFLETEAVRILKPRMISSRIRPLWLWGQKDSIHRRPRGIVGIIGTWNYPYFLNGVQIIQALTAGNAVIWKPSEVAPQCAMTLFDLLLKAGYSSSLIQRLDCSRDMGSRLIEADIQHLIFTGSAPTGRRIASRLGERLISSTLELSGCDSLFVLEDADVAMAARAALFGVLLNGGQTCLAVRRVFVHQSVYSHFCQVLNQFATGLGSYQLALPGQIDQANRLIRTAIEEGAQLLVGNFPEDHLPPHPYQPRILINAHPNMAICLEASFAPVLAILSVKDDTDALSQNELCSFGLGAAIFTANPSRAETMAAKIPSGCVTINDVIVPTAHPATPFGGRGESGWGVTQGEEGLLEMTVPQCISSRKDRFRPHFDLIDPKQARKQEEMALGLLRSSHAQTLGNRLGGWRQLLRSFWQPGQ